MDEILILRSPTNSEHDRKIKFTPNYIVMNLQDPKYKEKTLE